MSAVIRLPVIAGVEISTDEQGRFNLNALHRASGLASHKAPNQWLRLATTKALVLELDNQAGDSQLGQKSINMAHGGADPGTFAHELLALSYAGWMSPAFQLQVNQVFIDYRTGKLSAPAVPQSLPEALRLAAEAIEERDRLAPKAEALDRLSDSGGSLTLRTAAKDLQMNPTAFNDWLQAHKWLYRRRSGRGNLLAYQDKIRSGYMMHKAGSYPRADGSWGSCDQPLVTPKGLAKLAQIIQFETDVSVGELALETADDLMAWPMDRDMLAGLVEQLFEFIPKVEVTTIDNG